MAQEVEEEQPLDPEVELVRRKMLRLMIVSIGIMGIGLFSVLGAIVYKLGSETGPGGEIRESNLSLPQGSRITGSSVGTERLVLEVTHADGGKTFIIVNTNTGRIVSRIRER